MKKLIYNPPTEKYGFILFPAKFGDRWDEISSENHLFIYYSDFEYIIPSIKKAYPLISPDTNEIDEEFDVCGTNWIHNKAWDEIIKDLRSKEYECPELKKFVNDFCLWVIEGQGMSDEIVIQGTL